MNLNLKLHWENSPAPIGVKGVNKIEVSLPLGAMIVDPTSSVTKAYVDDGDFAVKAYADTQLSTKASLTDLVQLEADLQYDLSQKADTSALLLKADKAYVDSQDLFIIQGVGEALANKAEQHTVDSMFDELSIEIQGKADSSYVDNAISLAVSGKADQTYIDSEVSDLQSQLNLKPTKTYVDTQDGNIIALLDQKADALAVTQALSNKADLVGGKVPASQLPVSLDDVLEGTYVSPTVFNDMGGNLYTPESGKLYISVDTNKTYRWTSTIFAEVGGSGGGVVLGETSSTAYRGDMGKVAYDHAISNGNPHNATTTDIPEGTRLYFTEDKVRATPISTVALVNTPISASDNMQQALGKLQGQVNVKTSLTLGNTAYTAMAGDTTTSSISEGSNLWFTPYRAVNSALTGITSTDSSQVTQSDTVISSIGKLQNQVNTKTSLTLGNTSTTALAGNSTTSNVSEGSNLYFTDARAKTSALSAPLTGLSTSTGGVISASDTVVGALGKLQNQVTIGGGGGGSAPVWVNVSTVGTVASGYVSAVKVQVARFQGMLWFKGAFNIFSSIDANSELCRITASAYKPYVYSTTGNARIVTVLNSYNMTTTTAKPIGCSALGNIVSPVQASTVDVIFETKVPLSTTDVTINIPPTVIGTLAVP